MPVNINADTVVGGAVVTADASGVLALQAAGSTQVTINTSGVTLANALPAASGGTGLTSPGTNGNVLTSNGTAWVSSAPSGAGNIQQFTSSGTWTKPSGANFVLVRLWGAGGGGGGGGFDTGGNNTIYGGAGGGGGGFVEQLYRAADLASTVAITIGSGGSGGTGGNSGSSGTANDGSVGGTTSFGTALAAFGGRGGRGGFPTNSSASSCIGGAGGGHVPGFVTTTMASTPPWYANTFNNAVGVWNNSTFSGSSFYRGVVLSGSDAGFMAMAGGWGGAAGGGGHGQFDGIAGGNSVWGGSGGGLGASAYTLSGRTRGGGRVTPSDTASGGNGPLGAGGNYEGGYGGAATATGSAGGRASGGGGGGWTNSGTGGTGGAGGNGYAEIISW